MAEIILNEYGQKVRCYDWTEYQRRLTRRKLWKGDVDLNGQVLIIKHTWGIGDILYSTPALRGLKEKFPKVSIRYICTHPDMLENNPDVDEVYHWADYDAITELSDKLDQATQDWYWLDYDVPLKGGYDYKVHLRTKPQLNEHLSRLLRQDPKTLSGDERDFVNQASSAVISRYQLVALDMYCWHAYVDPPNKTVHYYPYDYELEQARSFLQPLRASGKKVILLMPHASTVYKDYPHWKEVIRLCPPNYFWVVMDAFLRDGSPWAGTNIFDCSGAFRIRQVAALIIESDLCCSSDTGLLYPRAARNRPCVVTYGPHEPEPFLHYFPSAHGLRIPVLKNTSGMIGMCSVGCYIDTSSCHVKGHAPPCLDELSPERVALEVQRSLEGNS
jgi:ADP-heptose:LPS heptosyltransferase